ncbi:phosphotransferase family protein [Frankia nepalensis]|uniref:Phosphotransferase family protein n=1 Tax=Frankia nepalensis TaxID=1836974 RepID=A0A937UND6_9ACTN|nr:phosphotransferase family protein [Frankia nepalensis]MBL7496937.1 phosphotransferase family protein [Frankia nepalensis]MBL7513427.1 phosphotransferase family protein [Frankia nepalensis]MBL7626130.1 phosphotransferase family protein [Frankia nepalensis]
MQAAERDPELVRAHLAEWLALRLAGAEDGVTVGPLTSPEGLGFSNETHLFDATWGDGDQRVVRRMVLRIAPTVYQVFLEPRFEEQYQVMVALTGVDENLPVPELFGYERDPSVLGAPFFVMGAVDGRAPNDNPPYHVSGWVHDITPADRAAMWWGGVDTLARVHRLDPRTLGLGFLDSPRRGRAGIDQQLRYYEEMLDWAGAKVFDTPPEPLATARDWLRAHQPAEPDPPVLLWGDARIGNILFDDAFRVAAVLDWEMAELGAPETDLAWFLFLDRHHSEGCDVPRLDGFPTREQTIARYEQLLGRPVRDLDYYEVFAAYRFAVIMLRIMVMFVELGMMDPTTDMITNNTVSRMLATLLGLPAPGPPPARTGQPATAPTTVPSAAPAS